MRLLLAEDDRLLGQATCMGLMQRGYAVDWVTNGNQVITACRSHAYDCVLLDLNLPELDGEACLRNIRAWRNYVPVVVLTARSHVGDRIDLLDHGADDYMVKPFDLEEMAARVRAVVRRAQSTTETLGMTHGPLRLMPLSRSVQWHDAIVQLTSKEFWILEALVRRRDRPVTRQQLEEMLYGWGEEVGSNAVEVHIHHLRRKLHPKLVLTVRGAGYQIAEPETLLAQSEWPGELDRPPSEEGL
jgi:DNA-binding response OmpR family regulator